MKVRFRRAAKRLVQLLPAKRRARKHAQQRLEKELMQERVETAIRYQVTEIMTARGLADQVPEAEPYLRAVLLDSARRRGEGLSQ